MDLKTLETHVLLGRRTRQGIQVSQDLATLDIHGKEFLSETVKQLCNRVIEGQYIEGLLETRYFSQYFLENSFEDLEAKIGQYLKDCSLSDDAELQELSEYVVYLFGVLSLQLFTQQNWTGPLASTPASPFKNCSHGENLQKDVIEQLRVGGETAYAKTVNPEYLLLAIHFLRLHNCDNSNYTYKYARCANWWRARCLMSHQRILSYLAESLQTHIGAEFNKSLEIFKESKLLPYLYLEMGLYQNYFKEPEKTRRALDAAKNASGMSFELTGVLGVRTRFQENKVAQLVMTATSQNIDVLEDGEVLQSAQTVRSVKLEDDTLLPDGPTLDRHEGDMLDTDISFLDQAILLAFCLDVKNANPAHDGITSEQMMAYVQKIVQQQEKKAQGDTNKCEWMLFSTALLLRSRLESEKARTVERGVMQLQALVDQQKEQLSKHESDDSESVRERMRWVYQVDFPPIHELKKELGEKYLKLGVARSALQIFEELEMWDEIITCYAVSNENNKAERLVRQRLEVNPSDHLLWCILGDFTNNEEYYLKAWEISKHLSARSQRALGALYLKTQRFTESVECFERALNLSSLYPNIWFSLGCVAMRCDMLDKAANAFTRVVQLQPDEADAWNNLASIYIKQKKKREAYVCLQEALKNSFSNYKIWENFLYVCMDIGEFQQALHACNQIMDLKEKHIDVEIVGMLVHVLADLNQKGERKNAEGLQKKLGELLGRITSQISNNPQIWDVYALYNKVIGNTQKVFDCYLKKLRATQVSGWEKDQKKTEQVVDALEPLLQAYCDEGSVKSLALAKMQVTSVMKRTQDMFSGSQHFATLEEWLRRIESLEANGGTSNSNQ